MLLHLGSDVSFAEINTKPIGGFGADLLIEAGEGIDATKQDKLIAEGIRRTMAAQKTFRAMRNGEEVLFPNGKGDLAKFHFTVGPFRDGVDCWVVAENGFAQRL